MHYELRVGSVTISPIWTVEDKFGGLIISSIQESVSLKTIYTNESQYANEQAHSRTVANSWRVSSEASEVFIYYLFAHI